MLDLDTETLEVYAGGTRDAHAQAARDVVTRPGPSGYWACRVLTRFSLDNLPAPDDFSAHVRAQG